VLGALSILFWVFLRGRVRKAAVSPKSGKDPKLKVTETLYKTKPSGL
jgi:hypothetical protein